MQQAAASRDGSIELRYQAEKVQGSGGRFGSEVERVVKKKAEAKFRASLASVARH